MSVVSGKFVVSKSILCAHPSSMLFFSFLLYSFPFLMFEECFPFRTNVICIQWHFKVFDAVFEKLKTKLDLKCFRHTTSFRATNGISIAAAPKTKSPSQAIAKSCRCIQHMGSSGLNPHALTPELLMGSVHQQLCKPSHRVKYGSSGATHSSELLIC